jgi:signal transduction histidine kinase
MVADAIFNELAELHAQARAQLTRAGSTLHNDTGPLLVAAGLQLQMVKMDVPAAAERIQRSLEILDQAMASIRELSEELNPLPVHRTGLRAALERLSEKFPGLIRVSYSATAVLAPESAAALYEAAASALDKALESGSTRIAISVAGKRNVSLRVRDNGASRARSRLLAVPALLARQAGLKFAIATGKSTIVSISNARRRSVSRRS